MPLSANEEICRWAYAKAMRLDEIRKALRDVGRAVYLDPDTAVLSAQNRFVLWRVDMHADDKAAHSLVYCNGVCVG